MNVLWIVVDCLRFDACSINGYHRPTTQAIDSRLKNDFINFTDAASQSGFTLSSSTTMLTSRYPSQHGVMTWSDELPADIESYRTYASAAGLPEFETVTGMRFFTDEWGLDAAFDNVHTLHQQDAPARKRQPRANEIRNRAQQRIDSSSEFNQLLWFFDVHTPWQSDCRFNGESSARDHYDTEIQYVAEQLEHLFTWLEQTERYDDTLIVLTADHGDLFDEATWAPWSTTTKYLQHIPRVGDFFGGEYLGHLGLPLTDHLMHVPLFVKLPEQRYSGMTVPGQIELIDIVPTILDVAGHKVPEKIEGSSLLQSVTGDQNGKKIVRAEMQARPADGRYRVTRTEGEKYLTYEPANLTDTQKRIRMLKIAAGRALRSKEVFVRRENEKTPVEEGSGSQRELLEQAMADWPSSLDEKNQSSLTQAKKGQMEDLGYL